MNQAMHSHRAVVAALALLFWTGQAGAQNTLLQWTTWTALQAVPSPGFTLDHGAGGTSAVGELRWQVVPFNYSFGANPLSSPAQFFIVNPFHRHSGSIEAFLEPAWALKPFRRSGDDRLGAGFGVRMFLPLAEYGETLSFSIGAKYLARGAGEDRTANAAGLELGVYTLFGIVGAKADLTTDPSHRAAFSLVLKYY